MERLSALLSKRKRGRSCATRISPGEGFHDDLTDFHLDSVPLENVNKRQELVLEDAEEQATHTKQHIEGYRLKHAIKSPKPDYGLLVIQEEQHFTPKKYL